jgi:AcrR family transcriptional regulator
MATTTRQTAAERKDAILDAALVEFSRAGLAGTSTEDIARRAGISQPYLFRLFGTKKELFKATAERCMRQTLDLMQTAAAGLHGEDALGAIGKAYMERRSCTPTSPARMPRSARSSAAATASSSRTRSGSRAPTRRRCRSSSGRGCC